MKPNWKAQIGAIQRHRQLYQPLSLEDLSLEYQRLKAIYIKDQSFGPVTPQGLALACELIYRMSDRNPYPTQLRAALAMTSGKVVNMGTGEGKTITAVLVALVWSLSGRPVYILTANAYLAQRDAQEWGPLFQVLGLRVDWTQGDSHEHDGSYNAFQADILYSSHGVLGFRYLNDQLAIQAKEQKIRDYSYVILDEIDEALIDGAQTSLVISGADRIGSNLPNLAAKAVALLEADKHFAYDLDKRLVWLTDEGSQYLESFFRIQGLYDIEWGELNRHVHLALKARVFFLQGRDYLIREGQVVLISQRTGRLVPGTRLQAGVHQAIEAKEGLHITKEQKAIASIAYPQFFKLFDRISGMSATANLVREELKLLYGLDVVKIPPHKKLQIKQEKSRYFHSQEEKELAIVQKVLEIHQKGQPILIGTRNMDSLVSLAAKLQSKGLAFNALSAIHEAQEAAIIGQAGQFSMITLATVMAGRGSDILLGPGVAKLGGLYIIEAECLGSRRLHQQLMGRCGRQGDPGSFQSFVSGEDSWFKEHYSLRTGSQSWMNWQTKQAIRKVEEALSLSRTMNVQLDAWIDLLRQSFYQSRQYVLSMPETKETFWKEVLTKSLQIGQNLRIQSGLTEAQWLQQTYHVSTEGLEFSDSVTKYLKERLDSFEGKGPGDLAQVWLSWCLLKAMDQVWMEDLDFLEQAKSYFVLESLGSNNPIRKFREYLTQVSNGMQAKIYEQFLYHLLTCQWSLDQKQGLVIKFQ